MKLHEVENILSNLTCYFLEKITYNYLIRFKTLSDFQVPTNKIQIIIIVY